jgi:hypothetical protein
MFLLISLLINILFFSFIRHQLSNFLEDKSDLIQSTEIKSISDNKVGSSLNDFFAIFILPMLTFSISNTYTITHLLVELSFVFLLLTVFIFRTEKLTSNIFIYLIFNIYNVEILGENFTLLSKQNKQDIESSDISFKRIVDKLYVDTENLTSTLNKINLIIIFFYLFSFAVLGFVIHIMFIEIQGFYFFIELILTNMKPH